MKVRLMPVLLMLTSSFVASQDKVNRTQEELRRLRQDTKACIAFLEDPQRDAYQKPQEVVTELDLKEGEVIADVGAGSGYCSLRFAHHAGERGRVYAVERVHVTALPILPGLCLEVDGVPL